MHDRVSKPNTLRCPTKPYRLVITTGMAKKVDLHSLYEWGMGVFRLDNLLDPLAQPRNDAPPSNTHLGADESILHHRAES